MSAKTTQKEAALIEIVEALTGLAAEQELALMDAAGTIMLQDLLLDMASEALVVMDAKLSLAQVIIPVLAAEVQAYEQKERAAAELAAKIMALRNQAEMANLPIDRREVRLVVDEVAMTVVVRPETREMNTKTTYDEWGDPHKVIVTSTAKAYVNIELPFLGKVKVDANMTYTDTSYSGANRHMIENVIEFTLNIAGRDRPVKVVASGMVNDAGYGWEYGVDVTVGGQPCKWCGGSHGEPLEFKGLIS